MVSVLFCDLLCCCVRCVKVFVRLVCSLLCAVVWFASFCVFVGFPRVFVCIACVGVFVSVFKCACVWFVIECVVCMVCVIVFVV